MRTVIHRIFPLNFDSLRPLHPVRAIAAVLAVVLLGNSVVLAAGAPHVQTADGRQLEVPVNDKQNSRSNDN
jgi:hypothetical protein